MGLTRYHNTDIYQTRFWSREWIISELYRKRGLIYVLESTDTLVEIDFYAGDLIGCCCLSCQRADKG